MSGTESELNHKKYSESLFSASSPSETLARIKQTHASERRQRKLNFLKYILPICIILLVIAGFVLHKPIMAIIRGPQPPAMSPKDFEEQASAEKLETQRQVFGNPDAVMKLHLRFPDESFVPEGILELAHSAVESKPSEIHLTLEYGESRPEDGPYQILINGQSEVNIETETGTRKINFSETLKEEDFILALESVHAKTYGKVAKPLKLNLSNEILERHRQQQEAAPAVIMPGKGTAEIKAGDKTIILPDFKANTTVISP